MSTSYVIKTGLTASTNTSYTISMWVKLTKASVASGSPYMWSCGAQGSGAQGLYMNNSDMKLGYYGHTGYTSHSALSDGSLRDYSGWYHIVWSVNAGTGTCYINGVQQGSTRSGIAPLNAHGGTEMALNTYVGTSYSTYDDLGPLMSHVHFIDGTAYPATTFGETDSTTGEWKIKTSPSVTYGTNGFFLFKDNASVNDQSGNGNNFTASGTVTQTEDNPSNVFCTINPLGYAVSNNWTLANGNTAKNGTPTTNAWRTGYGTIGASSGKYYFEMKVNNIQNSDPNNFWVGIVDADQMVNTSNNDRFHQQSRGYGYHAQSGASGYNNNTYTYGNTWTTNDIIGVAIDLDNSKLYFSKNGTWQNSGVPTSGSTGTGAVSIASGYTYLPAFSQYYSNEWFSLNFGNGYFQSSAVSSAGTNASGNGIFEYDVPTGYTALSTKGLNL